MAASQRQLGTITRKLEDFQKDKQALQEAISIFAGNVTSLVNTWLSSRGTHGPHFQEMIGFLANSSRFIVEKAEEIEAKGGGGHADGTPSSSSTSSLITSSPTSSSPTASPHPVGTSAQVSELSEQLKKLTTRFDGLSDQFSSSLQEYTQNRNKDNGRMKKLKDRMTQVENSVHDMSVDLSRVDKKVKKYDEKIGDLDKKVGSIEERQSVAEKEKKKEGEIITNMQKKLEQRECDQKMLKDVTERVKRTEEEMRNKYSGLDKKVGSIEQRQSVLVKEKKKEGDLIRNIQKKIEQKESDQRMLEDLAERVEKIEKEKERVDVKIQRLDTLDDHLRGMEKKRGNDTKEHDEMKRDLTACNSKVDSFEKRLHPVLGFTARTREIITVSTDTVVKKITYIVSNRGDHYSPTTGVFTAPVDGLYVVALTHQQFGSDTVCLYVVCKRVRPGPGSEREKVVCVTETNKELANCSDMSVVEMTGGDKLYVKVVDGDGVYFPSGFACFLIG